MLAYESRFKTKFCVRLARVRARLCRWSAWCCTTWLCNTLCAQKAVLRVPVKAPLNRGGARAADAPLLACRPHRPHRTRRNAVRTAGAVRIPDVLLGAQLRNRHPRRSASHTFSSVSYHRPLDSFFHFSQFFSEFSSGHMTRIPEHKIAPARCLRHRCVFVRDFEKRGCRRPGRRQRIQFEELGAYLARRRPTRVKPNFVARRHTVAQASAIPRAAGICSTVRRLGDNHKYRHTAIADNVRRKTLAAERDRRVRRFLCRTRCLREVINLAMTYLNLRQCPARSSMC